MNRKSILVCTVIAVLLLGGVIYLFYSLFFDKSGSNDTTEVTVSEGAAAVPSDAVFLYQTDYLSELLTLADAGSSLDAFYSALPQDSHRWETVWSVHYASKNKVAPLLIIKVPEKVGAASLSTSLSNKFKGVIEKRFNSHIIYKAAVPNVSFAAYGDYLITSPSIIILESSLRHLDTESSILDEPWLDKIRGVNAKDGMAHISFDQLGKLFSGIAASDRLRHASFTQSIADWGTFGQSSDKALITFEGKLYNSATSDTYSEVLLSQRGRKSDIYSIAPFNAGHVLSIPITSYSSFISAYKNFLTANGKKKDYDYLNAILPKDNPAGLNSFSFVASLDPEEIAIWSHGTAGESPRILAVKTKHPQAMPFTTDTTVFENVYQGYIPTVLGDIFTPSSDSHYMICKNWILFSNDTTLTQIKDLIKAERYFTLGSYLEQTPAAEELRGLSNITLLCNLNRSSEFLAGCLKDAYGSRLKKSATGANFQFAFIHGYKLDSQLGVKLSIYSDDLTQQPSMPTGKNGEVQPVIEDIEIEIPEGPWPIKNFKDGTTNYIEQLANSDIRLLNSKKNPVWTIKFKTPISGTVQQIDYLKNNKLQILFGSEDKIYLFDRLGRPVGKYPHSLGKNILLGPKVYDLAGDKNYTLVVLHEDNTISQYNTVGEKLASWNDIAPSEKIIQLPELIQAGVNYFWVVRTLYQTLVYNSQGLPVADFSDKKNKLRRDTEIEVKSSHEIAVTTIEGKNMVLDLNNGKFRKL